MFGSHFSPNYFVSKLNWMHHFNSWKNKAPLTLDQVFVGLWHSPFLLLEVAMTTKGVEVPASMFSIQKMWVSGV